MDVYVNGVWRAERQEVSQLKLQSVCFQSRVLLASCTPAACLSLLESEGETTRYNHKPYTMYTIKLSFKFVTFCFLI